MVEDVHVALIDDDKIFHILTKKVLSSALSGGKITEFYDGQEALDYLHQNQHRVENLPDIIFLDIQMPFVDGWQFLDQFVELTFEKVITLYVVSSSISTLDYDKSRFYDAVSGFIIKPFPREKMIEIIDEFKFRNLDAL